MFDLEPPVDDGLPIPEVGPWSARKHHFLRRYMDVFTTGMKNKRWDGLHYVDLFAGAGLEQIKGGAIDWGSPLIAAQAPNKFSQLHLCERNRNRFRALSERVARFERPMPPQIINDDANRVVDEIVAEIPSRSLTLAFLDPTGLHVHLETVRCLSVRRADLIVFFPDHLDALRNWEKVYAGDPDSNLDLVLGTPRWRDIILNSPQDRWPQVLRDVYEGQLRSLGYRYFDFERVYFIGGRPLYLLMFCSKDERGGEFWRKIATNKPGGQRSFEFGE